MSVECFLGGSGCNYRIHLRRYAPWPYYCAFSKEPFRGTGGMFAVHVKFRGRTSKDLNELSPLPPAQYLSFSGVLASPHVR